LRLQSAQVSRINPALCGRWTKERRRDTALSALRLLAPERFITHRVPLREAGAAYALLRERQDTCLQVLLTY
jgi:threonine dehydrogenase-like Zn-dependent dehydrogenase